MGAPILETNNAITPEISVKSTNPDITSLSDCDSSDEKSLSSKASDENFRPTHHNLLTPQLK
ncbi:6909_t:CDS:1, partial [Acaulospora morrowiae]